LRFFSELFCRLFLNSITFFLVTMRLKMMVVLADW